MKKVWVLEEKNEDTWKPCITSANYRRFCGQVITKFREADKQAVDSLKNKIKENNSSDLQFYSEDIKNDFKQAHLNVIKGFRVVQGEVPDDIKDYSTYTFIKENEGVLMYLWGEK